MLEKVKDMVEMDRGQVQDLSHWESTSSFGSVTVELMADKLHMYSMEQKWATLGAGHRRGRLF